MSDDDLWDEGDWSDDEEGFCRDCDGEGCHDCDQCDGDGCEDCEMTGETQCSRCAGSGIDPSYDADDEPDTEDSDA